MQSGPRNKTLANLRTRDEWWGKTKPGDPSWKNTIIKNRTNTRKETERCGHSQRKTLKKKQKCRKLSSPTLHLASVSSVPFPKQQTSDSSLQRKRFILMYGILYRRQLSTITLYVLMCIAGGPWNHKKKLSKYLFGGQEFVPHDKKFHL
jgi:hypothetical protein